MWRRSFSWYLVVVLCAALLITSADALPDPPAISSHSRIPRVSVRHHVQPASGDRPHCGIGVRCSEDLIVELRHLASVLSRMHVRMEQPLARQASDSSPPLNT